MGDDVAGAAADAVNLFSQVAQCEGKCLVAELASENVKEVGKMAEETTVRAAERGSKKLSLLKEFAP